MDMIGAEAHFGSGRRASLGSTTDVEASKKESFSEKSQEKTGDHETLTNNAGIGYACKKGLKPESPNQDSWLILRVEDSLSIYAVFDGHGQYGHDVSNFVKDNLVKLIIKDRRFYEDADKSEVLRECFKKCQSLVSLSSQQKGINSNYSGTTATVAVHDHNTKRVTVAHAGDSNAVLIKRTGKELSGKLLTREHKPGAQDEKARIEKAGGTVIFDGYANYRVYAKGAKYPGLNMSRCIGDLVGHVKCGITADPEVCAFTVSDEDLCLLVCSDGVWEFNTPAQAAELVVNFEAKDAMKLADLIARRSWDKWITEEGGEVVDDITSLVIFF